MVTLNAIYKTKRKILQKFIKFSMVILTVALYFVWVIIMFFVVKFPLHSDPQFFLFFQFRFTFD